MEVVQMMLGIQIIGLVFALFMLYLTFLHFKRKEFTFNEAAVWFALLIIFAVITLIPAIVDPLVETLNIARTMDLYIIAGFMFLIFSNYYIYSLVRVNQKKIEKVVREVAIKRAK
jgi:hypothetical protein